MKTRPAYAAWTTGGPLATGTQEWAVIGFEIAGDSAYDLSDYEGVTVTSESGDDILVIVKTSGGGYFADYAAKTGSTSMARDPPRRSTLGVRAG